MSNDQNKKYNVNTGFQKSVKKIHPPSYYIAGIEAGDLFILSEAITLIESKETSRNTTGLQILEYFYKKSGHDTQSIRLAITGAPGVGKSTFIENYGQYLTKQNKKLAVLAIDPSSQLSKGSILGDKTRMENLALNSNVFIRPSSAGDLLGGVAHATKPSILLCEAAGFDTIIVETVGVGQSEYLASMMVDFTIMLLQPGAGDDVQGIKRGILELADLVIVNKAEKDNMLPAKKTAADYRNALKLFHNNFNEDGTEVLMCSSIEKTGFNEIYNTILKLYNVSHNTNQFLPKRYGQESYWFDKMLNEKLLELITNNKKLALTFDTIRAKVKEGKLSSLNAVSDLGSTFNQIL